MHTLDFGQTFDVIIGNSFLHHFHNVPHVLARFAALLRPGGCFISLHEPTPMATVVEGAKLLAYPLAVVAPAFVNNVARARHRGAPSPTDIWLFEPRKLRNAAIAAGFSQAKTQAWNLRRPIDVQRHGLHLGHDKPELNSGESELLLNSIRADALLRRFLPSRFFGALSRVCVK
jgi:SAM-dependent methyltransferase